MMTPTRRWWAAALLLGPLALGAGLACSSDQAPYNRLTSLRVMAIRSDPAVPALGETATYSALVYVPPDPSLTEDPGPEATAAAAGLTYSWDWCPFPGLAQSGYPCLFDQTAAEQLGLPGLPDLHLGDAPTATLTLSADPAAVKEKLCAGMGGKVGLNCDGGVPIQIKLVVKTQKDTTGVTTVFTTRWALDPTDANQNPTLSGLSAVVGEQRVNIDAMNVNNVTFSRNVENALALPIDLPDQSETYQGLDDNKAPATLQERLFVRWFVETGDTKEMATGLIPGKTDLNIFLDNTWTPATVKNYAPGAARIYLVLRDNRAGVGWYEGRVNLAEAPVTTP